ncbi:MAG: DNA polymerase II large subunit, partial [Candidatus Thermoplasmatota archaeon]
MENNALLPDASYCYEWLIQDLQKRLNCLPKSYTTGDDIEIADKKVQEIVDNDLGYNINLKEPSPREAFELSERYNLPLHPFYNLFWHDIKTEDIRILSKYILEKGEITLGDKTCLLKLPYDENIKRILIELGALHKQKENNLFFDRYAYPLIRCCGLEVKDDKITKTERYKLLDDAHDVPIDMVSKLSGVMIRARAPFRIGARMGRPEKAAARKMRPPPHVLFPVGNFGGSQRLLQNAAENVEIEVEAGCRLCPACKKTTYKITCDCGAHTEVKNSDVKNHRINLSHEIDLAKKRIKERELPEIIKGVIGTISKNKTPEPLEKGILRAKHNVYVFKDGTIRFDMTDAPLTHFKPREIGVSVQRLIELGYNKDYRGEELKYDDQICELKVQDVIISKECAEYFIQVSRFIDDLLVKFYHMDRFYKAKKLDDLIGHLVIGLAPHTSAGALGRIIGFTTAQVCFAHPFYHATKRRNADGDEDGVMLLMDALLNFSKWYIPDKRGGRMDLPLILTTRIDPAEVDKEAHNLDTLFRYPLALYEASLRHDHPRSIESMMGLVASRIGTELQYEHFGFTHDTTDISTGPKESLYKTLKTMMEKMNTQLTLAAKIRAVDEADVAYKVIERHFLPDIQGNLRAFSKQSVRCPTCNLTYRRIPIQGVCTKCGGKLTLTVHEMSVRKYLNISKEISERYHLSPYAYQRLKLIEKSIDSLFISDHVKTMRLTDFL